MAWTCVFSKQSLPPALCGHTTLHPQGASRVRPPFSLSYGGNLPSSLTTVRPSPRYSLPDHLCRFRVRAATALTRGFSRQHGITLLRLNRLRVTSHPSRAPDFPGTRATGLHHDNHRVAELPSCVTPSLAYYRIGSHAPPPQQPPEGGFKGGFGWLASPAPAWAHYHEHGNINPLSIDYA